LGCASLAPGNTLIGSALRGREIDTIGVIIDLAAMSSSSGSGTDGSSSTIGVLQIQERSLQHGKSVVSSGVQRRGIALEDGDSFHD
jgi:hypothetical protein